MKQVVSPLRFQGNVLRSNLVNNYSSQQVCLVLPGHGLRGFATKTQLALQETTLVVKQDKQDSDPFCPHLKPHQFLPRLNRLSSFMLP